MAPNIGDSIKSAVEGAAEAVEHVVGKLTGHSHVETDEAHVADNPEATPTPTSAPEPMVVQTAAISEPLEFERTDTDGNKQTLNFEPADGLPVDDHPGAAE